jgi:antitoxin VapB
VFDLRSFFNSRYVLPFIMALNIKNDEVERLVTEVAAATGKSKTETVRRALETQHRSLSGVRRAEKIRSFVQFLEDEVWPVLPPSVLGVTLSKEEEEAILGYGPEGV